jgi:hypothetical protein
VLNEQFGPIWRGFKGEGSVIDDISDYMTNDEKVMMREYAKQYGTDRNNN